MAKINQYNISFSAKAQDIITTYSTINDRISVIYAKEFNGAEYYNQNVNKDFLNLIKFDNHNELYIVCSVEDQYENLSYVLHKYKMTNNCYVHLTTVSIK